MVATKIQINHRKTKMYGVQMEGNTIRTQTACKEMEYCHFFISNIVIEVVRSLMLTDVNTYADNEEHMKEDISRYVGFCIITLKPAILIH